MSWQATAAPTSAGIPRIPSVFFAFASSETVHLACGGQPMTKVHARYAHTRILPNSLSPTYSFPSSLGPIFVSSLRFKFRGKVETRGSFKSGTCAGYNIWILKSFFSSRRILVDVTIESRGYPLVNLNTYRQLVFNLTLENVMSCAS